MENWKTYKVEDLTKEKVLIVGDGYRAKNSELSKNGLPFARGANINQGFLFDDAECLDISNLQKAGDKVSRIGDVVFTSKGTVGRFAFVRENTKKFVYSPQLCYWRILNSEFIHPRYLYFWVHSKEFFEQYNGVKNQTDMADYVSLINQRRFHITLPPITEQRRIAQILSLLDDKIELNRQMNTTLEAMAKALFKAWFVDFEPVRANSERRPSESASPEIAKLFPNEFEDGLPKGWRNIKLKEVIEIKHGYAFSGEFITDKETENILLTPGNFKIGGGFNSSKFKYFSSQFPASYILERNDLIVTMTDLSKNGDTLGYPALVPFIEGKKLLHNQRLGKIIFKDDSNLKLFLYFSMLQNQYKEFVLGSATGSTVRHTSPTRICDYKMILPPNEILIEFEKIVRKLTFKEQENSIENHKLAQIRDSLLPRLISGKIRVGEAEKML